LKENIIGDILRRKGCEQNQVKRRIDVWWKWIEYGWQYCDYVVIMSHGWAEPGPVFHPTQISLILVLNGVLFSILFVFVKYLIQKICVKFIIILI